MLGTGSDSLIEMDGIVTIFKQETSQAVFHFKAVEELTVLMVLKVNIKLLIPHHTLIPDYIYELEEKCMSYEVIYQRNGSNQLSILPLSVIRISNVKSCDSGINDLVICFRNCSLDFFLVSICQDPHVYAS